MSESFLLILLIVLNFALIFWLILSNRKKPDNSNAAAGVDAAIQLLKADLLNRQLEGYKTLKDSLEKTSDSISERLSEGHRLINSRLSLVPEIENRLGQLTNQARNMEELGKEIQSLADILKPPKLRGTLGEMLLENLLAEILPNGLYDMQYQFTDGRRVDAVVHLDGRLLPIDSKFPLEAYQRFAADENSDVREILRTIKKHVDDISTRYIRPEERTTEFAVMYIPSEAIYGLFVADGSADGLNYALSKKIIPSSPSHLYAFLLSLSVLMRRINLSAESDQLIAGLDHLAVILDRLVKLQERMEGSMRAMTSTLKKARDESSDLAIELGRLRGLESDETDKNESSLNAGEFEVEEEEI